MTDEHLDFLIGKLEVFTTDGDFSNFTQEDMGYIYLWMFNKREDLKNLSEKLKEMRQYGEQKDDAYLVNQAQKLLSIVEKY